MGITLKEIERKSFISNALRHPTLWLPPNNVAAFVASTAMSALVGPFPQALTLVLVRPIGNAANVTITATTGAGFGAGEIILFEVSGKDENYDPVTELISMEGTGGATQTVSGVQLFHYIDSIRVLSLTGAVAASGASFSVGIGNGTTDFTQFGGSSIRIPHPVPELLVTSVAQSPIYFTTTGANAAIIPNAMSADGRQLIFSSNTNGYGTSANLRACAIILTATDGRSLS